MTDQDNAVEDYLDKLAGPQALIRQLPVTDRLKAEAQQLNHKHVRGLVPTLVVVARVV